MLRLREQDSDSFCFDQAAAETSHASSVLALYSELYAENRVEANLGPSLSQTAEHAAFLISHILDKVLT